MVDAHKVEQGPSVCLRLMVVLTQTLFNWAIAFFLLDHKPKLFVWAVCFILLDHEDKWFWRWLMSMLNY